MGSGDAMKGRDLLILAAVVLVAGFAVADAIRTEGSAQPPRLPETQPATTTGSVVPPPDAELGRQRFDPVPDAPGSVVLTEAGDCPVREFQAATGDELPNVVARSTCQLWTAPVTAKVAVGIAEPRGDAVPFRFFDLARGNRNLGSSSALFGFIVWSQDGQRAAWCNDRRVGIDLELGQGKRRLPQCPIGYTPDGEVAFARGSRLFVAGRTLVRAAGTITFAHFGNDGSIAVGVGGTRVERYVDGRLTGSVRLRGVLEGRMPTLSPDDCAALVRAGNVLRPLDLGCSRLGDRGFPGWAAAWAPDGRFLAVAGQGSLRFYDLEERREVASWPLTAIQIAWRR
jgi:hypothetical protein